MIIISFPTIMDGQVLRWYRDRTAVENGDESMSVSRNGVQIAAYLHQIPDEQLEAARNAYERLKRGQEVPDVATHTIGFFGRNLAPIEREKTSPEGSQPSQERRTGVDPHTDTNGTVQAATGAYSGPPTPPACPTCSPPMRETVGMVCQTCGTDYAAAGQ